MKLCECGCGLPTPLYKMTEKKIGAIKGQPARFIRGHNGKIAGGARNKGTKLGAKAHNWIGGRVIINGYVHLFNNHHHHRSNADGYVREHILVAEKALGRPLPLKVVVHHINEVKTDNRNKNLVICQDDAYHKLLHSRMRAFKACGSPNFRRCRFCKQWDDPSRMKQDGWGSGVFHRSCKTTYSIELRKRQRAARKNDTSITQLAGDRG